MHGFERVRTVLYNSKNFIYWDMDLWQILSETSTKSAKLKPALKGKPRLAKKAVCQSGDGS